MAADLNLISSHFQVARAQFAPTAARHAQVHQNHLNQTHLQLPVAHYNMHQHQHQHQQHEHEHDQVQHRHNYTFEPHQTYLPPPASVDSFVAGCPPPPGALAEVVEKVRREFVQGAVQ